MNSIFFGKVKKYKESLKEQDIDFIEIARTSFFSQYLGGFLASLTSYLDIPAQLRLLEPGNKEDVSASRLDGKTIYINIGNPLVESFVSQENKMFCIMGFLFHEIAHMRYMDFKAEKYAIREIEFGRLPYEKKFMESNPYLPQGFLDAVRLPSYQKILKKLYTDIGNVISDCHDEERLCANGGGLIRKSILVVREAQFANTKSLEDMIADEGYGMLAILLSLILQYARYGNFFVLGKENHETKFYLQFMSVIKPELDAALKTDIAEEKFLNLNAIAAKIWPFIHFDVPEVSHREMVKEDKELMGDMEEDGIFERDGDSEEDISNIHNEESAEDAEGESQGSSVENKTQEDTMDQMSKAFAGSGGDSFSDEPADIIGSGSWQTSDTNDNSASINIDKESDPGKIVELVLKKIEDELIEEKAEEMAAEEQYSEVLIEIQNGNICSLHQGIQIDVRRAKTLPGDKEAYEAIVNPNRAFIKKIEREIRKIFQEETNAQQRRRIAGPGIDTRNLYKVDQRYFMKKKNPEKILNMAISILVDNSGSMQGRRLSSAKEAAVLLNEVLEHMEIPTLIAGHHCHNWPRIHIFKYFEDKKHAKYSINQMPAEGDNRDGLAIEIAGRYLAERDEQNKLLIIVSDGQPNSSGYTGELARLDIKNIVRGLRQQGVKVLAFAIGDDKEQIYDIYGEAFIDISDYNKFPKILAKIIKKEIISNI